MCAFLELQQVVVVQLVVVLADDSLDLGGVCPREEVLVSSGDQEGRVRDGVGSDAHVTLLDEGARLPNRLRHPQANHHDGQSPPAEGGNGHLLRLGQRGLDVG